MVGGGRQRPAAAAAVVDDATGPDGNIAWKKWLVGVGRNKPAINFTPQERNNKDNKNKSLKRKPFWLLLGRMVNAGLDADAACETVFQVYTLELVQLIFLPFLKPYNKIKPRMFIVPVCLYCRYGSQI